MLLYLKVKINIDGEVQADRGIFIERSTQFNLYTYIIGHYNPSVRIIDLVSHTTYVVCVNFIHMWWDLQFKDDSEHQIIFFFEKLFMAILFTLRVFARNLLRGNRRRNNFRLLF